MQQIGPESGERLFLSLIRNWFAVLEPGRGPQFFRRHFEALQQGLGMLECPVAARALDNFLRALTQPGGRPVDVRRPCCHTVSTDEFLLLSACSAIRDGDFQTARRVLAPCLSPECLQGALRSLAILTAAMEAQGFGLAVPHEPARRLAAPGTEAAMSGVN